VLLLVGCASTELRETGSPDGSFAPEFDLVLSSDKHQVCSPGNITVTHELTNVASYSAWVCRLSSHEVRLGCHGYLSISAHLSCEDSAVLAPGESISWTRDLTVSAEGCNLPPELSGLIRPCCGSLQLKATGTLHVARPGKKWPNSWVVRHIEAEGPAVSVVPCVSQETVR